MPQGSGVRINHSSTRLTALLLNYPDRAPLFLCSLPSSLEPVLRFKQISASGQECHNSRLIISARACPPRQAVGYCCSASPLGMLSGFWEGGSHKYSRYRKRAIELPQYLETNLHPEPPSVRSTTLPTAGRGEESTS